MQAVLGLIVFSMLLTAGASLDCDVCTAQAKSCSKKTTCPEGQDACMSIMTEIKAGQSTTYTVVRSCTNKKVCTEEHDKAQIQQPGGPKITVECSKAPPSAGSFFLALSGLLLLKILV